MAGSTGHSQHVQFSPLERCPNEILSQIHSFLSISPKERKQQLCTLRLTSPRLNVAFTPFVIKQRHMCWWITSSTPSPGTLRWQPSSGPPNWRGSKYKPVPKVFAPFISSIHLVLQFFVDVQEAVDGCDRIREFVDHVLAQPWDEISGFISLRAMHLNWMQPREDEETCGLLYQTIADKLLRTVYHATNGRVLDIEWSIPYTLQLLKPISTIIQPFQFQGIRRLCLVAKASITPSPTDAFPSPALGDFIRLNPNLLVLELDLLNVKLCAPEEHFLPNLDGFPIQELTILGSPPMIRSATKASMSVPTPAGISPPPQRPTKIHRLQKLLIKRPFLYDPQLKIHLDSLWSSLKECGARLSQLSSFSYSNALMGYLSSYDGLEEARLDLSEYAIQGLNPNDNAAATTTRAASAYFSFAKAVLPHHASTLTTLRITYTLRITHTLRTSPQVEALTTITNPCWDDMAINPGTWPSPSSFTRLRTLEVVTPRAWRRLTPECCQPVLDYAVNIPNLVNFRINWNVPLHMEWGVQPRAAQEVWIKRCALRLLCIGYHDHKMQWIIDFPSPDGEDTTMQGGSSNSGIDEVERFELSRFKCEMVESVQLD